MNTTITAIDVERVHDLQALLLELASHEEDLANAEAAATAYWEPQPESVVSHRSAAAVLRAQAMALTASFAA